ncbi:MAG: restriction endonuclease subunit S [Firmicutes bacterium]|nr:restriction endonuclease subunit S [Bacillota bacterium]
MLLKELADIQTGLVLSRARAIKSNKRQQVFTLSSVTQNGIIKEEFNEMEVMEQVNEKYLSREGDLIIRLSLPSFAALIDKENENILIPSQFAIIRIRNDVIVPGYLNIYLNSNEINTVIGKKAEGTVIKVLSVKQLGEFEIPIPPLIHQQKIVKLFNLIKRHSGLMGQLDEKEKKKNKYYIEKLLKGEIK